MASFFYRASFYLYELSFFILAATLWLHGLNLRQINRALHQPPYWLWSMLASGLLFLCALNHYYVYHMVSPRYLATAAPDLLLLMYILKTISMLCLLCAGVGLALSHYLYCKRFTQ